MHRTMYFRIIYNNKIIKDENSTCMYVTIARDPTYTYNCRMIVMGTRGLSNDVM